MRYRPELDGIRGVAILLVIACHLFPGTAMPGWLGVDMFFVLSGYLITNLLVADHDAGRIRFVRFYARRAARLLPAVVVMLAVVTAIAEVAGRDVWHNALTAASYASNYTHSDTEPFRQMWSLAVEEQFYLVWPIALAVLLRVFGRRAAAFVAVGACFVSWEWLVLHGGADSYQTQFRGGDLLLGCALALVTVDVGRYARHAGMVGFVAVLVLADLTYGKGLGSYYIAGIGIATALLIVAPPAFLSNRSLTAVGRVSYSLYLWHYPALSFGRDLSLPLRIVVLALACVAAVVSYRLVERPFRHWANSRIDGYSAKKEIFDRSMSTSGFGSSRNTSPVERTVTNP